MRGPNLGLDGPNGNKEPNKLVKRPFVGDHWKSFSSVSSIWNRGKHKKEDGSVN